MMEFTTDLTLLPLVGTFSAQTPFHTGVIITLGEVDLFVIFNIHAQ